MVSPSHVRILSPAWRYALIGALVSLPVSAIINWLPNSEATIGGGIMIVGALVAGGIAAIRSTEPSAAGLRAGFLGGLVAVLIFLVTVDITAVWPLSRVIFWVFAGGISLCVAPLFGRGCGRIGGWVTITIVTRWKTSANVS
ncbi:hypothetical protein ZOD2009_11130 [Haladaptatus paucihalophilus DX253]|uniref:Uncharacterized protein n=1 Tax=Haladaptatus paucihalophilus DX253 TaxID=797209 RepID=E7QTU8_HALPU|nr:DUF5518 domain-containing protein [Haladaptatus paucihalophilus]EFW92027.1 hypothetical protein ZOD2009_11130 [Haladaptatus paucihalophilus DX253]SHK86156.1 hypothetical protein SAMN05444342_2430 [Haladaptatus paucihalophilus DX253]